MEPEAILEEAAGAVRAGEFARLGDLAERLVQALDRLPSDPARLRALRAQAAAQADLLAAAAEGVRAARQRVEEIGRAARLTTYDSAGAAQSLRPGAGRRLSERY
jgi:hypothetical protein